MDDGSCLTLRFKSIISFVRCVYFVFLSFTASTTLCFQFLDSVSLLFGLGNFLVQAFHHRTVSERSMNSSSQDASRGQSRPGEGSAKQSKRPKDNGRHSSSWIRRLHRHQSRNNQPSNPEAERPLLANDYPGEDDEEAQIPQPSLPLGGKFRLYRFLFTASRRLKKAVHDAHNFWARNPKQILLACVLALLALLVSLSVSFYFHHTKHEEATTCESPACVHAAAGILENLDPDHASLDACIQFDQMVCGGWQQRHDLRPDQSDIFTGTMMAEASNKILRHILEQNSSASTLSAADQDNFNKLKDDYDACMNEEELQEIGLKPLQDLVGHVKMHFPSAIDLTGRNPFPTLKSEPRYQVNPDGTDQLTDTLLFLTTLDIGTFLQFYVEVSVVFIAFKAITSHD